MNGVKMHTSDKMHLSPEGADLVAGARTGARPTGAGASAANASVGVPPTEPALRLRR